MAEPRRTLMDLVEAFERVHRQYQAPATTTTEPKKVKLTPRQRFLLKMEKMKMEDKKNDA
jgi:hypothetical protein